MEKRLQLPNGHLSWSGMDLLERSPQKWVEHYLLGMPTYVSPYMTLGKEFASAVEMGFHEDPIIDMVAKSVPRYDMVEHVIEVPCKTSLGEITLHARLDTFNESTGAFLDHKTSKKRWSQSDADRSGQITFYDTAIWLKNGSLAGDRGIVWVETAWEGQTGRLTGNWELIETTRTMVDILQMMVRIDRAVTQIAYWMNKEDIWKK